MLPGKSHFTSAIHLLFLLSITKAPQNSSLPQELLCPETREAQAFTWTLNDAGVVRSESQGSGSPTLRSHSGISLTGGKWLNSSLRQHPHLQMWILRELTIGRWLCVWRARCHNVCQALNRVPGLVKCSWNGNHWYSKQMHKCYHVFLRKLI